MPETIWSYSRLNKYYTCPFSFKQSYIEGLSEEENCWGVGGGAAHDVLEDVFNGVLDAKDAADVFFAHCPRLTFPTMKETYGDGWMRDTINFFYQLPKLIETMPEVIGVEKDEVVDIKGHKLRTIVDLELLDGEDLICWDWKSSRASEFSGAKLREKSKQLYLYSAAMKQRHGKYPSKLIYYLFREQKKVEIDFSLKEYNKAVKWMCETIEMIEKETIWEKKENYFFCKNICGTSSCEYNGNYKGNK